MDAAAGFTVRSALSGDLVEDRIVGLPGAYEATATAESSWTMIGVAFAPAP
jgi:hypothetical protein